ncbi:DEAD/DEAH box helicase [Sphingomonas baiyangensis]|uniref:DEAD/DEAH box helicase n=1 Tax=Sphingomonas baiyangensis TaxID=2572576 RepID=A0A4U1L391_9SPHN|nr:DEAD/DEAH box helicase [Sphingomonas baiyangensis]TKD50556.1 DEAD/DEAH box helicase [Sphingomonas baiyangensis]
MELRDYQATMLDEARALMRSGTRRVLLRLATGGGKTVMAASMLGGAADRGLGSQFIVHRRELIEQTSVTFRSAGIEHGLIASGMPEASHRLVQLAGVQTLVNRLERVAAPKLIVMDECHHAVAGTWQRVLETYPGAFLIGLTATPERLDGRGLKDQFDAMVDGPSTAELIARGFLSPFRYFAPGKPDLVGVPERGGDFNRSALGAAMDKPKLVGDVVEHYQRLAPGEQGIVFAASRDHSRHIAEAFAAEGVAAAHIDGSMSDSERARIVEAFRAGDLRVMSNVDLFGEGFDVPGLVYCGLARPTKSLSLFLQQVGRALRIMPGKSQAIICDHAGNAFTHGLPDDPRQWTLEGRAARAGGGGAGDGFSVRQCLDCYQVSRSTVAVCPCGSPFPIQSREPEREDGDLFELKRVAEQAEAAAKAARKDEERACVTLADWEALARKRGYKPGWAKHQWEFRQKFKRRKAA